LAPSAQLAEARRVHDNGDYAAARAIYADIIRQQPTGSESDEARWRLGQAYMEDGQLTEAYVALSMALEQAEPAALPAVVDFWIGDLLAQLGNPTGAVEAYRRYLAREDVLAGEVNLRIGRLLRAAGDLPAAQAALQEAVAKAPDNFILFAAREELAEAAIGLSEWSAALEQFDLILGASQYARYRAELQYRAGQVLEKASQPAVAVERYRQAIAEDENSPGAMDAATALRNLGQAVDDYTWARILLGNGYTGEGIAAMYSYLDSTPDHPARPHLLVAEANFGLREYAKAIAEWQALLDTHPEYTDRAGVLMRMAAANGRLGNVGLARDLYEQAAAVSATKAPGAHLEAARLAESSADCQTAAAEYLDVARLYPNAAEAGEALYRGGICQYRLGQVASALASWQRLVAGYRTNTYAHAGRFWAGKAALELGDAALAAEQWQGLRAEAADSYYTARAAELAQAAGLALNVEEQAPEVQSSANAGQAENELMAEAEQWLASWAAPGVADPTALRQLPTAVAADPQLQRGEAYLRVGLRGEALREFDAVRERFKDDPATLYSLALHFRELGAYRHATLAAVRLGALAPGGLFRAPLVIQRLAYPTYFVEIVEAEAFARGLDPLLIYALIRQESFFERGARSYAAAQGLTQVIPSTAEWIASAIGWANFQPSDIYKPYLNIKFGVYYLWAALEMFDDNPYPALVGYNAGPGNASYWLEEANTDDDDLYVEEISLAEPKLYVRRVLAHYDTYKRLYDGAR
jgi:soluble lytic murein transglycosylase